MALPRGNNHTSYFNIGCKLVVAEYKTFSFHIFSRKKNNKTTKSNYTFFVSITESHSLFSHLFLSPCHENQCQIPESFINSRKNSCAMESLPSSQSTSSSKPEERRKKRGGSLRKFHRMLPKLPTDK